MSKSIIIQQSGFPEALTVDALRTSKLGGGSEDWLPADGKNLVELDIGGSGTYRASDYGAYGISVARVSPKYGGGATSKAAQQPEFGNLHIPVIQEGGKPVLLSARMVKTNLQGGGTCLWVPEDEVNLETKYVDHSGTYTARADGCYGYSQVTVSGVDIEITQDEDGDDVAEITDGGETRQEKLPSEIRIEREPDFVGPYGDGAYISFDGLLVKAYTASGKLWTDTTHTDGVIPMSELIFPVTVTDISQVGGEERDVTGTDLIAPVYLTLLKIGDVYQNLKIKSIEGAPYGMRIKRAGDNCENAIASYFPSAVTVAREDGSFPVTYRADNEFTYNGKTCYINLGSYGTDGSGTMPFTNADNRRFGIGAAAGIALLGTKPIGGQPIPVQWARPYDGLVLEDTFDVEVVELTLGGQGDD